MRPESGNSTTLPLLAWAIALAIAALMLGMIATGMAGGGASSDPAWSGNQAPPGAAIDTTLRAPGHGH